MKTARKPVVISLILLLLRLLIKPSTSLLPKGLSPPLQPG